MIEKVSLPKISAAPKKQMRISAEDKKAKALEEKVFKNPDIHWEPCLTTTPIFIHAKNMDDVLAAYRELQKHLH